MVKKRTLSGRYNVHLVRHAHAGKPEEWEGDDALRPLTQKGLAQAQRLASFMKAHGITPDVIVSSPLLRAAQTAQVLGDGLGVEVVLDERVADFSLQDVAQILFESGAREPLFVGHNPDFAELLAHVTESGVMPFKKCALATVDLHADEAGGTLRWLIPPSLLKK